MRYSTLLRIVIIICCGTAMLVTSRRYYLLVVPLHNFENVFSIQIRDGFQNIRTSSTFRWKVNYSQQGRAFGTHSEATLSLKENCELNDEMESCVGHAGAAKTVTVGRGDRCEDE